MIENTDMIIFWGVVLARFIVPLFIPRYPLPAILLALVIDGVDQTIFQLFTDLNLDSYQSYDKALDIYYLTIAYLSTIRNWTNVYARKVVRFLWYYRLFGVFLFELIYTGEGPRWILFIFPNTFEYFFIFYEVVRLKWNPMRLSKKAILGVAAFIWIFIKLPQEYWIHIAQNDTTDIIKERIYGVPVDTGLIETVSAKPGVTVMILLVFALAIAVAYMYSKKLPSADHKFTLKAESSEIKKASLKENKKEHDLDFINPNSIEKIVLITLVSSIFAQMLPSVQTTPLRMMTAVAFLVFVNIFVSHQIYKRDFEWKNAFSEFGVMLIINFLTTFFYLHYLRNLQFDTDTTITLFFSGLFTLMMVLFPRVYSEEERKE